MRFVAIALSLLLLLVTGCSTQSAGGFEELTYHYSGGIAGFDQRLALSSDGTFQIAQKGQAGKKGKIGAADLKAVSDLVAQVQWATLQEKYVDPKVADAIFQEVSVVMEKGNHTTLVGTGGAAPAELGQLLAKLKLILDANK